MNLLDENIIASQRELLRSWKISIRQIGYDFEEKGLQDDQIISLLHQKATRIGDSRVAKWNSCLET